MSGGSSMVMNRNRQQLQANPSPLNTNLGNAGTNAGMGNTGPMYSQQQLPAPEDEKQNDDILKMLENLWKVFI